jgi:hypothetical protein
MQFNQKRGLFIQQHLQVKQRVAELAAHVNVIKHARDSFT